MKISILTLFPEMFSGPFEFSIVKRAIDAGRIEIDIINVRDYGIGTHKTVDDTPYGGGHGMVMRVDVLHTAISKIKDQRSKTKKESVVLLSASGKPFSQNEAKKYSKLDHLILICGHYEGVDARIKKYIDCEISVGDFVTTGGEIPAMLVADSVTRLIPGVLKTGVTDTESFSIKNEESSEILEYPQYTKPPLFDNQQVPDILLSGHHKNIDRWRMEEAHKKTITVRPDLLKTKKAVRESE